jgi:hypothetical protein
VELARSVESSIPFGRGHSEKAAEQGISGEPPEGDDGTQDSPSCLKTQPSTKP